MRCGMVVLGAAATLTVAGPAHAGGPERPQASCSSVKLEDRRGDVENQGLDLVGGFLSSNRDGEVFGNLVVADLNASVDQRDSTKEYFRVAYTDDKGQQRTADARLEEDGKRAGANWFDGPDGIVQIRLKGLSPSTFTRVGATTFAAQHSAHGGVWVLDEPPIGGDVGLQWNVTYVDRMETRRLNALCPPKPPAPPVARPRPTREPSPVKVGAPSIRGRTLRVPLQSSTRVTNLRGRLSRNGRVVARGRLDELKGRGVLLLTARRPFARGIHLLTIPGVIEQRLRIG